MMATLGYLILMIGIAAVAYGLLNRGQHGKAAQVLGELKAAQVDPDERLRGERDFSLNSAQAALGIFARDERREFLRSRWLVPLAVLALVLVIRILVSPWDIPGHMVFGAAALGGGYLWQRRREAGRKVEYQRSLLFYLPVVMERLVMGAQAGLDILPAIRAILEVDGVIDETDQRARLADRTYDPVSKLLLYAYRLTEAGMQFDRALAHVAERVESAPLRHAFIHLAVAHREGGELVGPLRELSDATQLYLQEAIEEEIAKMPVRATVPLVLTFAGLLIFFLASPLLQILDFIGKAKVG